MEHTITMEENYPYTPEEVWMALTEQASVSEWLMKHSDYQLKEGQSFKFNPGGAPEINCKFVTIDEPRKLAYTWQVGEVSSNTLVTWYLEAAGSGTKVRLEHTGFDSEKETEFITSHVSGWKQKVAALRKALDKQTAAV